MTDLKQSKKITCNPFRYLELYELQKILRDSVKDMPPETKELIQCAIAEKLAEEDIKYQNYYVT